MEPKIVFWAVFRSSELLGAAIWERNGSNNLWKQLIEIIVSLREHSIEMFEREKNKNVEWFSSIDC